MAPEESWASKFVPVARPQLLVSQDPAHPESPSSPTTQLILSEPTPLRGYYGEEFYGSLVAMPKVYSADEFVGKSEVPSHEDDSPERSHLTARLVSADGSVKNSPSKSHEVSAKQRHAVCPIRFDMNYPGKWQLQATSQIEHELETQSMSQTFELEVRPTVSIRFKVSRGTSQVNAHVLEAQVENMADGVLNIESCELVPKNGWQVESVKGSSVNAHENAESSSAVSSRPHEVFQYCFSLKGGRAAEAAALTVGWHREPLGAKGWQTTAPVRI